MTVHVANQIRPTGTPVYCSACRNQDSSCRHIDFDADCDRGYGDRDDGLLINMDDLILCETCIRSAGVLVGMQDARELEHELDTLRKLHRQEHDRADQLETYLNKLEDSFSARPEQIVAPRRRGRPPREESD